MALKERTCKSCHDKYMPIKPAQPRCVKCTYDWEIEKKVKKAMASVKKKRTEVKQQVIAKAKADKDRIKTRSQWAADAQVWVNKFIRLRDNGKPCVSCEKIMNEGGYVGAGGVHAGHYRSRGACPELRFHELNIHAQCAQCNNENSGNITQYRKMLILKIGLDKVDWLEGPHKPAKYTIDDLKEIIATYKRKCKELT